MGGLSLDGWRHDTAKRPIETKEQRDAWHMMCERAGLTSAELAQACAVSRQTASAWLNHPEKALSWVRFDEIARLAYDRTMSAVAPSEYERVTSHRETMAHEDMQHPADLITGRCDAERAAHDEMGACLNVLIGIYQRLDDDRRTALERVALDMLTAQEAER